MSVSYQQPAEASMRASRILGLLLTMYVSGAVSHEYYVVQDPQTHECHNINQPPTEHWMSLGEGCTQR